MFQDKTAVLLSSAVLVAAVTLTGCGGSAAKKASTGAASAAGGASSSSGAYSSSGAPSSSGASAGGPAKTCSAGHSQAMINGKSKCLAAGQVCSAKAVAQYPQYGFVCATSNGKLVLRRK